MPRIDSLPRKTVPFIYVIDTSGSMAGERIAALNEALRETIEVLHDSVGSEYDITINVLSYSSGCKWMFDSMQNAESCQWVDLQAGGLTDLGDALSELDRKLNKKFLFGEKSGICFPNIIFVTDGVPTDDWKKSLIEIKKNKWFQSSMKIAVKIGDEVDVDCLNEIVGTSEAVVGCNDLVILKQLIRVREYEPDDSPIIHKCESPVIDINLSDNKDDSDDKGYYLELSSQIVELEKEVNPILQCQLGPCSQEDALKEVFVLEQNKTNGHFRLKNVCVENLWICLKMPYGWGEDSERHVVCNVGDTIHCNGITSIIKTEEGITFLGEYDDWGTSATGGSISRELKRGEYVEFLEGDSILIGNKTIATLKKRPRATMNHNGNPFDF